jgi:hypothetical protein
MHRAIAEFWKEYRALPADIRERADKQFALLRADLMPGISHQGRFRETQKPARRPQTHRALRLT